MKKLFALAAAAVMAVSMTGCGSTAPATNENAESDPAYHKTYICKICIPIIQVLKHSADCRNAERLG